MDFQHPDLHETASSEHLVRLSLAGPKAGSTIDPVAELYLLDCTPGLIRSYADQLKKAADRLTDAEKLVSKAQSTMRGWRGSAGEAFRTRCGKLGWTCRQAVNRATNQSKEGTHIAEEIQEFAASAARIALLAASQVEAECSLLLSGLDLPAADAENAKEKVRNALIAIQKAVRARTAKVAELVKGLRDLHLPR